MTTITKRLLRRTVTISKADATEVVKTASGTVAVGIVGSVTLPAVPDGAAYGQPTTEADAVTILKLERQQADLHWRQHCARRLSVCGYHSG